MIGLEGYSVSELDNYSQTISLIRAEFDFFFCLNQRVIVLFAALVAFLGFLVDLFAAVVVDDRYDGVILVLLHLHHDLLVQRNVQQHLYLSDLFSVMR